MSRLPIVAGDLGGWGSILNDYLSVSLAADGTLKTTASVGGSGSAQSHFLITGAFSPAAGQSYQLFDNATTTVPVNANAFGITAAPVLNRASSGTHAIFASEYLTAPTIGAGAATITNAATLYIDSAPTAGTTNYGIWATGSLRFDSSSATSAIAFGGDIGTNAWIWLRGSFTGNASGTTGLFLDAAITGVANGDLYGFVSTPGFHRGAAGTHVNYIGSLFGIPVDLSGTAAVTNAATVYIAGAPSIGTSNYALWIVGGNTRVDGTGTHAMGGNAPASNKFLDLKPTVTASGTVADILNLGSGTLTAAANNDILTGIGDFGAGITIAKGAFTGLTASFISFAGSDLLATGGGTITDAATIIIRDAPSIGTNNYSLLIQGGQARLGTNVRFGTRTALGAEVISGYITITDDGGTSRKLAVIS